MLNDPMIGAEYAIQKGLLKIPQCCGKEMSLQRH